LPKFFWLFKVSHWILSLQTFWKSVVNMLSTTGTEQSSHLLEAIQRKGFPRSETIRSMSDPVDQALMLQSIQTFVTFVPPLRPLKWFQLVSCFHLATECKMNVFVHSGWLAKGVPDSSFACLNQQHHIPLTPLTCNINGSVVVDDSVAVDEIDKVVDDWEASCDVIRVSV